MIVLQNRFPSFPQANGLKIPNRATECQLVRGRQAQRRAGRSLVLFLHEV